MSENSDICQTLLPFASQFISRIFTLKCVGLSIHKCSRTKTLYATLRRKNICFKILQDLHDSGPFPNIC